MRHKILLTSSAIILFSIKIFAQVSGISGGKLFVPDAATLSGNTFEFEPAFSVLNSSSYFENGSNCKDINGRIINSSLAFRITAGISENLEAGVSFSNSLDEIALGTKYFLNQYGKFAYGLTGGVIIPAGDKFIPDTLANTEHNYSVTLGTVISYSISEKSSVDMTLSYTNVLTSGSFDYKIHYGAGYGRMISEKTQIVLEINGFYANFNRSEEYKMFSAGGITYRVTEKLLFVSGYQYDLIGKNTYKENGIFAAFTITFN
ncbi:MAG: transporter [Melioribacter sp.]|uniref:transporter n=1 Tax=Melioribacter sp. TaxID=2052167 RepID=UPI003BD518EE